MAKEWLKLTWLWVCAVMQQVKSKIKETSFVFESWFFGGTTISQASISHLTIVTAWWRSLWDQTGFKGGNWGRILFQHQLEQKLPLKTHFITPQLVSSIWRVYRPSWLILSMLSIVWVLAPSKLPSALMTAVSWLDLRYWRPPSSYC